MDRGGVSGEKRIVLFVFVVFIKFFFMVDIVLSVFRCYRRSEFFFSGIFRVSNWRGFFLRGMGCDVFF